MGSAQMTASLASKAAGRRKKRQRMVRAPRNGRKQRKAVRGGPHTASVAEPGGIGEETKLAKLLLAERAHRRRKLAARALLRKPRAEDEDDELEADESDTDED